MRHWLGVIRGLEIGSDLIVFRHGSVTPGTTALTSARRGDRAAGDKINLWGIDADTTKAGNQAFTFVGTADLNFLLPDLNDLQASDFEL